VLFQNGSEFSILNDKRDETQYFFVVAAVISRNFTGKICLAVQHA
jgi:hypothetical protein